MSNSKTSTSSLKTFFFWLITLLIPLILLVLIEFSLRVFGYNEDKQELFIEVPDHPDRLIVNPYFPDRYFPDFKPQVAPNTFEKNKSENTYRIFVLGGSSTQGFPYNYYQSFSAALERKLIEHTVGLRIEVINLGMTAVNSFVLKDIARKITPYEADAIVIYAGHNEYYGSFGAGSSMFGFGQSIWLKNLIIQLKDFRLYQVFENILKPKSTDKPNRTLMAEAVKESDIALDSDIYNSGIAQFDANVGDIVQLFEAQNVPVYLSTIVSNLKNQAPLSDFSAAKEAFERANDFLKTNQKDSAFHYFKKAKELDRIRFRAPDAINELIRSSLSGQSAKLVDAEKVINRAAIDGIPGNDLFTDHLHPNIKGNELIADAFLTALSKESALKMHWFDPKIAFAAQNSLFEQTYAEVQITRLLYGYPFIKGQSAEQERRKYEQYYQSKLEARFIDSLAALTWRTQRQVSLSLTDVVNYASNKGDSLESMQHYIPLSYWQLFNKNLLQKGVNYAINNRNLDGYTTLLLHLSLKNFPDEMYFNSSLAAIYLVRQDLERAEYWLKKAEKLDADDPNLLFNLARLYAFKKDSVLARGYFDRYRALRTAN